MICPPPPWIEITTVFPCSVGCFYCPQDVLASAYTGDRVLTLERFERVLANVPRFVLIDFAGFAEPFLNPECADMMLAAHDAGFRLIVNSTLIGLSDTDAQRLERIPFVFFYYHDVRQEGREYPFITGTGRVESPESRAGNLYHEVRRDGVGICAKSPTHLVNVMLPNGDVVLCCNDYGLKHPLGNLLETRFEDLERRDDYDLCHSCPAFEVRA
jgi:hypothetical protein